MSIRKKLRVFLAMISSLFLILYPASFYSFYHSSVSEPVPFYILVRYAFAAAFILFLFYIGLLFLLERYLFIRIDRLLNKLTGTNIRDKRNAFDEISLLEEQLSLLQSKLEQNQDLVTMLEHQMDLVSQIDANGIPQYFSPSYKTLLGRTPEELMQITDLTVMFHPDDIEKVFASVENVICNQQPERVEIRCKHADGHYLWFESLHYPFYNKNGELTGMLVSGRDITERKKLEEKLLYLSHYDALTGLYNRTYFEQEMQRMRKTRNTPLGIIICDVDGLKLINDGVGHYAGDKLLKNAAFLLKSCFRDEDVVARIGGDEFAVLLPRSDSDAVRNTVTRIERALTAYNESNPKFPLSMSVGYAVGDDGSELRRIYKEADDRMYQEKITRRQGNRNSSAQILVNAIETRDHALEGNEDRIQMLVTHFGHALNLSDSKIADLCLFARYHDIGKVGIPDKIIFKGSALTEEERQTMQRHSKIGNRIALSIAEISHIADWILKHHEWYNGMGYPLGLKGEEIPLECRIFALVDAYDAMTSPRPFRKIKSHEQALAELKNAAGTQFDPQLLDTFLNLMNDPQVVKSIENVKTGRAS